MTTTSVAEHSRSRMGVSRVRARGWERNVGGLTLHGSSSKHHCRVTRLREAPPLTLESVIAAGLLAGGSRLRGAPGGARMGQR